MAEPEAVDRVVLVFQNNWFQALLNSDASGAFGKPKSVRITVKVFKA